ncbi:MerR family transcriptional regulator [Desulfoluna spongiiphila]|uniref:MerR family transcriptional regulator n=1 Tax=Desulfoluna spongiiphila TaxID=419481 RepID=UPI001251A998|nr:MerR family transcriptional regulator [Desulfoluna spongiiphila]VVS94173.1 bacterial transcription activator effector binding [Desulfoluna spongiiphila]
MYKISHFSKQTKLSPRMLRHYDSIGLLQPQHVDEETGYRYYAEAQFQDAMEIIRLKRFGFSLEQIKGLLENHDPEYFRSMLRMQIRTSDQLLREGSSIIDEMEQLLSQGDDLLGRMVQAEAYGMYTGVEPERYVLRKRAVMAEDEMDETVENLHEDAENRGLFPYNLSGAVYHGEDHDRNAVDVEVFVPIRNKTGEPQPSGSNPWPEHQLAVIPSHTVVTTLHTGRYDDIGFAWHAIETWIEQSDYKQSGSPYEVFLRSTESAVSEHEYVTRVCYPVETS